MKKTLFFLSVLTIFALSINANAMDKKSHKKGGFKGPSIESSTVKNAKEMSDDTFVVLVGNITQNIGSELYVFSDKTGTINIEIDDEDWNGQEVEVTDIVEIRGSIEKNMVSPAIVEVEQINIINQ